MPTIYETTVTEHRVGTVADEINLRPGDRYDSVAPPASRFQNLHFLRTVAIAFGVLYLLPWCLIRVPSMERWVGSIYGAVMDYGYDTAGQNADVLLVGDSSLIMGVDPSVVSRELGLKVISLPNTIGSLRIDGEIELQRYLKANRPPRLIVMYLNPWNLNYTHADDGLSFYEGEEMMLRHGSAREVAGFFLRYPAATLEFPFRFYMANPKNAWYTFRKHLRPGETAYATGGHYNALYMFTPIEGACVLPEAKTKAVPMDSGKEFLAEYNRGETQAAVYLAPLPDCRNSNRIATRSFAAIGAPPPQVLKANDFLADPFYGHIQPQGVADSTNLLVSFIKDKLGKKTAPGGLTKAQP
jgi:hypothetical protein